MESNIDSGNESGKRRQGVLRLPGDEVHGFILQAVDVLDDYHGFGYLLRHRITGMEVYHVANADPELFFGYAFKTPPANDCGIPHIVEHSVLGGSAGYPVKDPFMSLLKGSANTFMNAMTYPDHTIYPAASPLEKDFINLFKVYSDAVFNPLLREETFWQEGVRLAIDEDGALSFEGVVLNEMLGEFSDHDSIVSRLAVRLLYPDTPYFHESGGDPSEITKLTYRQFAGWYGTYYHPSNCKLFLYGDMDITPLLGMLENGWLADRTAVNPAGESELAKRWTKPKTVTATSPKEDGQDEEGSDDASVTVSWATTCSDDPVEVLTLSILTDILLGNPGAPLYKAIIESKLSKDISQTSGMDTSFRQMPFTVGFKGIDPSNARVAQDFILDTLSSIAGRGIPARLVENAVKRQEFAMREASGDQPMGLRAMGRALRGWLQNKGPHVTIRVRQPLEELKQRIAAYSPVQGDLFAKGNGHIPSSGYFEQWIKDHLLDNPHRCLLVVKPDAEHAKRIEQQFSRRLEEIQSSLGASGIEKLKADQDRFNRFGHAQDSPEALASIPVLSVDDLPRDIRVLAQQSEDIGGPPLLVQELPTNGIVYTDGMLDLEGLDHNQQLLLPLYVRLLHMTGIGDIPYDEVAVRIRSCTGGMYFSLENSSVLDNKPAISSLSFRVKCLEGDHEQALSLLSDVLLHANVGDMERIEAVLNDITSDFGNNVISSGNVYASQRASAWFSPVLWQNELWNGFEQWLHLDAINSGDRETLAMLAGRLQEIQEILSDRRRLHLHLGLEPGWRDRAVGLTKRFVLSFPLPASAVHRQKPSSVSMGMPVRPNGGLEVFRIPSTVAYNAVVFPSAQASDPLQIHQIVLSHMLSTSRLWERVRGKGGAYGVSLHVDMLEQISVFSSYRDPRIAGTCSDLRDVLVQAASGDIPKGQLENAVVSIVSREIRPLYPKEASMVAFKRSLYGITDDFRRQRRQWLLDTTEDDLVKAANHMLDVLDRQGFTVVVAGQDLVQKERTGDPRLSVTSVRLPL